MKLRSWLLERFLPAWAKDSVYKENRALLTKLERKEQEIQRLNAYIDGLETGVRAAARRVTVHTGGAS